jgi:pilus assembly protein Flp/PilA
MKGRRGQSGQGMTEYVVILALVAIASIGAVIFFADNLRQQISSIAEELGGSDAKVALSATRQAAARYVYELTVFTSSDGE